MPEGAPQQGQLLGIYQQLYPDEQDQAGPEQFPFGRPCVRRGAEPIGQQFGQTRRDRHGAHNRMVHRNLLAEGWPPCEWPNNISPPMMANTGSGVAHTA